MGLLTGSRSGLPAGAHTTSSSLPGPPSLSRAQGQLTAALKPQLPGRAPMGGSHEQTGEADPVLPGEATPGTEQPQTAVPRARGPAGGPARALLDILCG